MGTGSDAMLKAVASHKPGDAKKLTDSYKPNIKTTLKAIPIKKMSNTMTKKKKKRNLPKKAL